jgi:hypothetical protein
MKTIVFFLIFSSSLSAHTINFQEQISTCLSTEVLWEQFQLSFQDSRDSLLWPNSSSLVSGEGLHDDARIRVRYQFGPLRSNYSYQLESVMDLQHFTYRALEDHPFIGGASVSLQESGDQVLVVWSGEYLTRRRDTLRRMAFERFEKNFFQALRLNIKKLERRYCHIFSRHDFSEREIVVG